MGVEDEETHYWIIAAVVVGIFLLFFAWLSWALHWSWLSNLWFNYAWSSDKGNGPEAIQQTIIYAIAAVVLIPPVRHFIKREFDKVHNSIHLHGKEAQEHLHHLADKLGIERFEHSAEYKEHMANHDRIS